MRSKSSPTRDLNLEIEVPMKNQARRKEPAMRKSRAPAESAAASHSSHEPPTGPQDDGSGRKPRQDDPEWRDRQRWLRLKDQNRFWIPWLLIRYKAPPPGSAIAQDVGLRPIPAGDPFWISPDIRVESSDPSGNAVAGEENFIHARIFNLGMKSAAPTQVDFYWADPSLGLGPGNMNHIGTEWVEVEEHTAEHVRCKTPWVPLFLNNGHECLMVNCSNPMMLAPGVVHSFPPPSDPITLPFQPRLDRHVGQRNITVLKAKAGQMQAFSLAVNNLFPMRARARITARIEHVRVTDHATRRVTRFEIINHIAAFGSPATNGAAEMRARFHEGAQEHRQAAVLARFMSTRAVDAPPPMVEAVAGRAGPVRGAACMSSAWAEHSCRMQPNSAFADMGNLLVAQAKLAGTGPAIDPGRAFALQEITLDATEQRHLVLQLRTPGGAQPGEFVVYHLAQQLEGLLVGGYTIVVEVVAGRVDPCPG
jgi:hypothetical protein